MVKYSRAAKHPEILSEKAGQKNNRPSRDKQQQNAKTIEGVMTYKILHDLCPENLRHKFTERSMISEYRTRNHGDLQIPKVRLEYAKRSFYFSGVKNWNDIHDNVRERDAIARFRTDLRDYLLNLSQDPNTTPW